MNSKVKSVLKAPDWLRLRQETKKVVKARFLELLSQNPELSGFALLPGETYEVDALGSVSSKDPANAPYFSLCPDEWNDWHEEFSSLSPTIHKLNTDFRLAYPPPNELMKDDTEMLLVAKFHNTFLQALSELKSEGLFQVNGNSVFVLIWISDTDIDGIVKDSVQQLNSPRLVASFLKEMEDNYLS